MLVPHSGLSVSLHVDGAARISIIFWNQSIAPQVASDPMISSPINSRTKRTLFRHRCLQDMRFTLIRRVANHPNILRMYLCHMKQVSGRAGRLRDNPSYFSLSSVVACKHLLVYAMGSRASRHNRTVGLTTTMRQRFASSSGIFIFNIGQGRHVIEEHHCCETPASDLAFSVILAWILAVTTSRSITRYLRPGGKI